MKKLIAVVVFAMFAGSAMAAGGSSAGAGGGAGGGSGAAGAGVIAFVVVGLSALIGASGGSTNH